MNISAVASYLSYQLVVPLLFVVSFVTFLWGLCLYVVAGSQDEELAEKGVILMLYALIFFVVVVLVWGVIKAIGSLGG